MNLTDVMPTEEAMRNIDATARIEQLRGLTACPHCSIPLLPCPFCGAPGQVYDCATVGCSDHQCSALIDFGHWIGEIDGVPDVHFVIEQWNKRALSPRAAVPAERPYYTQAFWSPCKRYLVTACISREGSEIALVDDNGDQWEPAGPCVDITKL